MASFLCRGNLLSHNFRTWSYWHAKATKAAKGSTHLFCHQHMTPCHLRSSDAVQIGLDGTKCRQKRHCRSSPSCCSIWKHPLGVARTGSFLVHLARHLPNLWCSNHAAIQTCTSPPRVPHSCCRTCHLAKILSETRGFWSRKSSGFLHGILSQEQQGTSQSPGRIQSLLGRNPFAHPIWSSHRFCCIAEVGLNGHDSFSNFLHSYSSQRVPSWRTKQSSASKSTRKQRIFKHREGCSNTRPHKLNLEPRMHWSHTSSRIHEA